MGKELTPLQKLEAAETLVAELKQELKSVKSSAVELEGKLNDANQSAAKANTDLAEANRLTGEAKAELERVKAELKTTTEELTSLKGDFDKRVSEKAAQIAASQGIPPVATTVQNKPTNTEPAPKVLSAVERLAAGAAADLNPKQ